MTPEALWEQLDSFARGMEPPVARAYRAAIEALRADLPQDVLDEVVRSGNLRPILDRLDLTNFKLALRRSLMEAAAHPSLPFEVRFDVLNQAAIRALQASEFTLIQGITTTLADGLRYYLTAGLRMGVNPVETAREIRDIIGLTAKQAQAVLNYRELLTGGQKGQPFSEALRRATRDRRFDQSVLRAIADRTPLKASQVEAQVQRFEERMLKARAETIARTETMNALYEGQMARWAQAIHEGKVDEGDIRRFWHTAKDERVCPICASIPGLNATGVAYNEPFVTVDGETLMGPTAHPNCRCVVFIRVVHPAEDLRKLAQFYSGLPPSISKRLWRGHKSSSR